MTQKAGGAAPPRLPPGASAAARGLEAADMPVERAQRLGISCAWCGFRMKGGAGRMRLFQSEGCHAGGEWVAHFHTDCGRAILQLCAERSLADVCPEIDEPRAAAEITSAPAAQRAAPATGRPSAAELGQEARDLARRGFTTQMIAARLRAPYSLVTAALAAGRSSHADGRGA